MVAGAEFLVRRQVPLSVFHQVGAYSDQHADATHLADQVVVRPSWHYGYERR